MRREEEERICGDLYNDQLHVRGHGGMGEDLQVNLRENKIIRLM